MPGAFVPVATERTETGPSPRGLMRISLARAGIRIEVSLTAGALVGTALVPPPSRLTRAVPAPGPVINVTSAQSKVDWAAVNLSQALLADEVIRTAVMPKGPAAPAAALSSVHCPARSTLIPRNG